MVGALSAKTLDAKVDINGTTFRDASTAVSYGGKSHEVRTQSSFAFDFLLRHGVLEEAGACDMSLPLFQRSMIADKLLMPGPQ